MTDQDTQHGGVMNRLENSRVAPLVPYWRAAAYDDHSERTVNEWAWLGLKVLGLGMLWILTGAAVAYAGNAHLTLPQGETIVAALDALSSVYEGVASLLLALAVMYVAKCMARAAEDGYEEVEEA